MSNIIPLMCVGLIGIASLFQQPKTSLTKESKGVINTEFTITVEDIVGGDSGFTNCKIVIKELDKQMIGPCSATDGTKFKVGNTYNVSRAKLDKGFITVNKAIDLGSPLRWEVIDVYVQARTSLMRIKNGTVEKVVGNNNNHTIGTYVTGY